MVKFQKCEKLMKTNKTIKKIRSSKIIKKSKKIRETEKKLSEKEVCNKIVKNNVLKKETQNKQTEQNLPTRNVKTLKRKSIDELKLSTKERKKQRKTIKDNFELTSKMKEIWEDLRRRTIEDDKKKELSDKLFNLVKGSAKQVIFAHDTVRVMETLIMVCTTEQRQILFDELKDDTLVMIKSKYARFFIKKILKHGSKQQINAIIQSIYGNIRTLIKNNQVVDLIDLMYSEYANKMQRANLVEEFYGPSFAVFKTSEARTLKQIILENPDRKASILKNIKESLLTLIDKSVIEHSIVHRIFAEYFELANTNDKIEMSENLYEHVVRMLHTRDGSRTAINVVWYSNVKNRKALLKTFKGLVSKICQEQFGYLVILSLFDSIDDTKIIDKIIFSEICKEFNTISRNPHGKQILCYLVVNRNKKYFHPHIIDILKNGDGNPFTKKSHEKLHEELCNAMLPKLCNFIIENIVLFLTDNLAGKVLHALLFHSDIEKDEIYRAIIKEAIKTNNNDLNVIDNDFGHWTLKKLILKQKDFVQCISKLINSEVIYSWIKCNRGCFVVLALLEQSHIDLKNLIKSFVNDNNNYLKESKNSGAKLLLKNLLMI